jgi:hypothetical protein
MMHALPNDITALALAAYFGGRAEVRIRREPRQVILCDFLSMYPTVCTLMGLWSFVIADSVTCRDATKEVRDLLERVSLADLQQRATWLRLRVLVRIAPDADIVPTRGPYDQDGPATIGVNFLSSDQSLWFTLADAIGAKLMTGRSPKIVRAMVFEPGQPRPGLAPVSIAGNPAYRVDPYADDFFQQLIELRHETKQRRDAAVGAERDLLDAEQNALKMAANATSYGIFAEVNVKERAARGTVIVHSAIADPYTVEALNDETPGRYFQPVIAALITGGARLMLAILERLVVDAGLDWAFCDTDSLAIAKPDVMADAEFQTRVDRIVAWFEGLNPYAFGGSILKVEDVNFARDGAGNREPLYCWAISAKRYALFNLDDDGRPILRKASAHGLGHLRPPYDADNPSATIPAPVVPLADVGVDLWQHDVWWSIVKAALDGHPDRVDFSYHPNLTAPAMSRYAATTPRLLKWVAPYNRDRSYDEQIKPFGFMLIPFADPLHTPIGLGDGAGEGIGGRRRKRRVLKPIAPFHKDPRAAARQAFDRETGEPIPPEALKSYADVLALYPLHPESKFLNGDFFDRGVTRRRHIRAIGVRLIGKEANRLEEQFFTGIDEDAQPDYGAPPEDLDAKIAAVRNAVAMHGLAAIAREARVPIGRARRALTGAPPLSTIGALALAARRLDAAASERDRANAELVDWVRAQVSAEGLAAFARRIGTDPKNLAKVVRGDRPLGKDFEIRLRDRQ